MADDDKEAIDELVRMTVHDARLQVLMAEFPEDLIDAAQRYVRVRALFSGPTDPTVDMWPMEAPE